MSVSFLALRAAVAGLLAAAGELGGSGANKAGPWVLHPEMI